MEDAAALYVVPTPLGNLADLTRRAEEVLRSVPWVAAEDTRHSGPLLKHIGSSARMLPAHRHNEHEAAARIVERLQAGESVALISDAGTPGISDPGARIVAAVRAGQHVVERVEVGDGRQSVAAAAGSVIRSGHGRRAAPGAAL